MEPNVVLRTEFKSLPLKGRGKVRDIYEFGDRYLEAYERLAGGRENG